MSSLSPSFAFRKSSKVCPSCGKRYTLILRPRGVVKKSDPKPHVCRGKKSPKKSAKRTKKSAKRSRSKKSISKK